MSWYSIVVTPSEITKRVDQAIFDTYTSVFIGLGAPKDANMWSSRSNHTGNVTYYLSPEAYAISRVALAKFGPQPCEKPDLKTLAFSVGHAQ